ncbi:MAG TPA: biopolymer transporter ExbD [Polyangiaceae bacterium LLY-WYZ-14_1]|jgi:biopolymer transport protein TolR|nr:biopolymer transporter ExbD [Polyangiaceae bacterium LLY-WYZ-14_1]
MGIGGIDQGGRGGQLSEINVTPLVDVMLVLLIIFMVSAPLISTGLDVNLPSARAPRIAIDEEMPLITVTRDRAVYLGEEEVGYEGLPEALRRNQKVQEGGEVFLQADAEVPYGFVVQVLAVVRETGIAKFGLVTDPTSSE